jgi:hypothetical protein
MFRSGIISRINPMSWEISTIRLQALIPVASLVISTDRESLSSNRDKRMFQTWPCRIGGRESESKSMTSHTHDNASQSAEASKDETSDRTILLLSFAVHSLSVIQRCPIPYYIIGIYTLDQFVENRQSLIPSAQAHPRG